MRHPSPFCARVSPCAVSAHPELELSRARVVWTPRQVVALAVCTSAVAALGQGMAGCRPARVSHERAAPVASAVREGPQTVASPAMRALAGRLRAPDPRETIRRIYGWVHRHTRPYPGDRSAVLRRRTAKELFASRTLSGCGDWGVLLASLLRAAGLPVVFVEAVGKRWIERYLQGGESSTYEGHVFLEVRTPRGWVLLDSSLPYLYQGHRQGSDDLPRSYRVMARGLDSWDIGVRDEGALHLAMHRAAQSSEPARWRDVRLVSEPLLARMVVIGFRETVAALRARLPETRVLGVSPRRHRSWAARCRACNAVALLPIATPKSLRAEFLGFVREATRLPAWEALPLSTPRFIAWKRGGLCLVIRDSEESLLRFAVDLDRRLRKARGTWDAATCLDSADR